MTDIHEATVPYVLHALDDAELVAYELHLAGCPTCRDELADLGETAAELSVLALATPRAALRSRVLDAVRATPQVSRPEARSAPPVDELRLRRRHRSRVLSGLIAAVLALTVGLGGIVYTLVQERQTPVAQVVLERQLQSAPDAVTTTSALPDGGRVTFIASRQLNRAMFVGTGLPDQGNNRFQLWTVVGTDLAKPTSVARDVQVVEPGSDVKVLFSGDIARADYLAVNLEPLGGTSATPTSAVLAVGATTA
jgi:anti-sigma-K factor RskA